MSGREHLSCKDPAAMVIWRSFPMPDLYTLTDLVLCFPFTSAPTDCTTAVQLPHRSSSSADRQNEVCI